MDWLTQAFAQYSIVWLALSAVVGLLAGAVSSWITYQFKKKEIADTVAAEIEKERKYQAIHQQKEKEADETFKHHLEPLRALLENVSSKDDDSCRWKRLGEMREALDKLKAQCQQVLKLPQEVKLS